MQPPRHSIVGRDRRRLAVWTGLALLAAVSVASAGKGDKGGQGGGNSGGGAQPAQHGNSGGSKAKPAQHENSGGSKAKPAQHGNSGGGQPAQRGNSGGSKAKPAQHGNNDDHAKPKPENDKGDAKGKPNHGDNGAEGRHEANDVGPRGAEVRIKRTHGEEYVRGGPVYRERFQVADPGGWNNGWHLGWYKQHGKHPKHAKPVKMTTVHYVWDNALYVPVREPFIQMGCQVNFWDGGAGAAVVYEDHQMIVVRDSPEVIIVESGVVYPVYWNVAPVVHETQLFVPVQPAAVSLGLGVVAGSGGVTVAGGFFFGGTW